MPAFEVTSADKQRAIQLLDFVSRELAEMSTEARFVFLLEMARRMKPELDELKRRSKENGSV